MTAAKEIYRVNLFPNPNFKPDGFANGVWDGDHSAEMPGDGTFVPKTGSTNYSEFRLPELEIGLEYVCSVRCADKLTNFTLWISGIQIWFVMNGGVHTARFTVQPGDQSTNRIVFNGGHVYSEPQLELASTFDPATAGGVFL